MDDRGLQLWTALHGWSPAGWAQADPGAQARYRQAGEAAWNNAEAGNSFENFATNPNLAAKYGLPGFAAPPPSAPAPTPATTPAVPAGTPGLQEGSQTLFGPITGGLPQGLGVDWHSLFGQEMLALMNADGTIRDPRTGDVMRNADGSPMPTQQAILQAANIAAQQAQTRLQERQQAFTEQQAAFQRAAAPNRAFENEIARGATGQNQVPGFMGQWTGTTPAGGGQAVQGADMRMLGNQSTQQDTNLSNAPVRVPGFINSFRTGQYVPTAGQTPSPSTVAPASQAGLTQDDFRLSNQKAFANYSPYQQQVLQSYGVGGGVPVSQQDYWQSRGLPSNGSAQPTYSMTS